MRLLAAAALSLLALACGSGEAGPRTTNRLVAPAPASLPAGLISCAVLGEVRDGQECRLWDLQAQAFADAGGTGAGEATPASAARRAFLYDRWLDLHTAPERQVMVRNLLEPLAPGDPESRFASDALMGFWDDRGDSAGFSELSILAAVHRWLVTGTEADRARFESWARGLWLQFEATGVDGYLARYHFAGVPPGTPILGSKAMHWRDPADEGQFDIPAEKRARFPAYYQGGLAVGAQVSSTPSWEGHPSIDSYAGAMNVWPLVAEHVRDAELKAGIARHVTCFLKRLRIFKVVNLSKNPQLQADLQRYLQSGVLDLDPEDPDLTRLDEVWGFYLPQLNVRSAATYPRDCPAAPAFDAEEAEVVDVAAPGFQGKLALLLLRMMEGRDQKDSMDFVYFPNVRAGDALLMRSYALAAHHLTGDPLWLRWGKELLDGRCKADQVEKTIGAFVLPKACRSYFRTYSLYGSLLERLLLENDPAERAAAAHLFERKFAQKEMRGLADPWFEVAMSAALGQRSAGVDAALEQLIGFGGTRARLDSPRRNYAVDLEAQPPPGIAVGPAPEAEVSVCTTPVTILGFTLPVPPPDPGDRFTDRAPALMDRPPDNYLWEKDPFRAVKRPWDAGRQQYPGLDFTQPYWVARHHGLLARQPFVLAWGPVR